MMGKEYRNVTLGLTTTDREIYRSWLRAGNHVEVYKDGKMILGILY